MLVEGCARLILALQDVPEARTQAYFPASIEHYLRASQIRVRHILIVEELDSAENLPGQVFEDAFW